MNLVIIIGVKVTIAIDIPNIIKIEYASQKLSNGEVDSSL